MCGIHMKEGNRLYQLRHTLDLLGIKSIIISDLTYTSLPPPPSLPLSFSFSPVI